MLQLLANADPTTHVLPHELFHFWGISFNNQMFMTLLSAVLMVTVFKGLFKKSDGAVPTGARNFFESILEFLRIEVFRPGAQGTHRPASSRSSGRSSSSSSSPTCSARSRWTRS